MTQDETWLLAEKYGGNASAAGYAEDCRRLAAGEPAAYVIGFQPFLGLKIYLDSHPLIPRVETEWWANELLSSLTDRVGTLTFLDLCAGSGAIGCAALASLSRANVSFADIDPAHEPTIRKNITENQLGTSRAHILIGDLFEPFAGQTFDVIAANPPYVPLHRSLPASVADHEPSEALYAGEDGLAVIRRIAYALPAHLAPHGVAWIECDSENAEAARLLFTAAGLDAQLRSDQYGVPRIILVNKP